MKQASSRLEELLAGWVADALRDEGAAAVDLGRVSRVIRDVLAAEDLDDEEAALIGRGEGGTSVGRLLERRIERAMQAGLEAAAPGGDVTLCPPAPAVIVPDQEDPGDALDIEQTLVQHTLVRDPGGEQAGEVTLVDDVRPRLVLVDDQTYDATLQQGGLPDDGDDLEMIGAGQGLQQLRNTLQTLVRELPPPTPDAAAPRPPSGLPGVGDVFHGKYRIEKMIGEGGFGHVYKAREELVGYRVAIKTLRSSLRLDSKQAEQFKEEARRLFSLKHENIAGWRVFDQTEDGTYYFVMELLDGEELEDVLEREGRLDARRTGRILLQVLSALEAAHFLSETDSILHLDLKPKNVFVAAERPGEPEKVKVIDFGVGQYIRRSTSEADAKEPPRQGGGDAPSTFFKRPSATRRAVTGLTLDYASPEQCAYFLKGETRLPLDGRSDLFSFGVMGFRMLTGRLPSSWDKGGTGRKRSSSGSASTQSVRDKLRARVRQPCPRVDSLGVKVPRRLARFIDKCLELDREKRWQDSREALAELRAIVQPPLARRIALVSAVAVPLIVGVTALVGSYFIDPPQESFDLRLEGAPGTLGSGDTLYFGPQQRERVLLAAGLEPGEQRVRLIGVDEEGPAPAGWEVAFRDAGGFVLRGPASAPAGVERHVVKLEVDDGRAVSLSSFNVAYLGPASWEAGELELRETLGGRSLGGEQGLPVDPQSLRLVLPVELTDELAGAQDLELPRVRVDGGEPRAMSRLEEPGASGTARFELDLGRLKLDPGSTARIEVVVEDKAGNAQQPRFALSVARDDLRLVGAELVGGLRQIDGRSYNLETFRAAAVRARTSHDACDVNVQVLVQGAAEGEALYEGPLDGFDFAALLGEQSTHLTGQVVLEASDARYVRRADKVPARTDRVTLGFEFRHESVALEVILAGQSLEALSSPAGAPVDLPAVGDRIVDVSITRTGQNPIPLDIRMEIDGEERGGEDYASLLEPLREPFRMTAQKRIPFREGRTPVRIEAYQFGDGQRFPEPSQVFTATVVVDTQAPEVAPLRLFASTVRAGVEPAEPLLLRVEDPAGDEGAPAGEAERVQVGWSLAGDPQARREWIPADKGTDPHEWLLSWASLDLPRDGEYELYARAFDAVGNPKQPSEVHLQSLTRALDAPTIELYWSDADDEPWGRLEGAHRLDLVVLDPNGVGLPEVAARALGGPRQPELAAEVVDKGRGRFQAVFEFDYTWSEREVIVTVKATDEYGNSLTTDPERRRLQLIEAEVYPAVAWSVVAQGRTVDLGRMGLIEAPRGSTAYQFMGRSTDSESSAFRKAFNEREGDPLELKSAWGIEIAPSELPDFYLDRREVTVAQYLEFVRDPAGYQAGAHWPEQASPFEQRRSLLRQRLTQEVDAGRADLPVTGVTWEEAFAFARWTGRRLPSWVELEYAARGGLEYRSWAGQGAGVDHRGVVNIQGVGAGGPRAVGASLEVTPDTGIYDLSGNVREWTATPVDFLEGQRSADMKAAAQANRVLLVDPRRQPGAQSLQTFAVFGGSFRGTKFTFETAEPRTRINSSDDLGFRCAISLSEAREARGAESVGADGPRALFLRSQ